MARQFDAVVHLDRTQALWPLDRDPGWIPEGGRPGRTRSACERPRDAAVRQR